MCCYTQIRYLFPGEIGTSKTQLCPVLNHLLMPSKKTFAGSSSEQRSSSYLQDRSRLIHRCSCRLSRLSDRVLSIIFCVSTAVVFHSSPPGSASKSEGWGCLYLLDFQNLGSPFQSVSLWFGEQFLGGKNDVMCCGILFSSSSLT